MSKLATRIKKVKQWGDKEELAKLIEEGILIPISYEKEPSRLKEMYLSFKEYCKCIFIRKGHCMILLENIRTHETHWECIDCGAKF